jgi:hypothetical protein
LAREFHLSPPGKGHGVSCDAEGAFIGAIPILRRLRKSGEEVWHPRDCDELSNEVGEYYGLPIDISSKAGGLRAITNALNEGDVVRAQIATALLGIPDPPPLSKRAHSRERMIKLIRDLHWSGLIKADWDPSEHPRRPAGSADSVGGDFAPKGEGDDAATSVSRRMGTAGRIHSSNREPGETHRVAQIQLADNAGNDAVHDSMVEAVRVTATAQRNDPTAGPQAKPVDNETEGFWQTLNSRLSPEIKSARYWRLRARRRLNAASISRHPSTLWTQWFMR